MPCKLSLVSVTLRFSLASRRCEFVCVSVCVSVCETVSSGTRVRPMHAHPCQCLLCWLAAARATRLLVIECVGSIMTLGGGRGRRSVKQNGGTARQRSAGFWGLSPLTALNPTKMSGSQQGGSNAIPQHSAPVCAKWDVTHCIIYRTGSYCTLSKLPLNRGAEAYKSLITSFINVMTIISQR